MKKKTNYFAEYSSSLINMKMAIREFEEHIKELNRISSRELNLIINGSEIQLYIKDIFGDSCDLSKYKINKSRAKEGIIILERRK